VTNTYLDEISKGKIPEPITKVYHGDFNSIKESVNRMISAINGLVNDTQGLITHSLEGDLSYRADASRHQGEFKNILDGVNSTLDAVVEPIKEASQVLESLSRGELNIRVQGDYKGDHAQIKLALNQTMDTMQHVIKEINHYLKNMADGNLNLEMTSQLDGDFVEIKHAINYILDAFNQLLSEINEASNQVTSASSQVSQSAMGLSQGATEQASAVEQISSSVSQIADQSVENSTLANKAENIGQTVLADAEVSNTEMQGMMAAMSEINDASNNISKIIKVIDEITFQTNILALNAAVEAARAGEHGKGFAVVAEEVRDLAARSAQAAKETTSLIQQSLGTVRQGTEKAEATSEALEKIITGVNDSQNLVTEIAQASTNQVEGLKQVNYGVSQISDVTQSNSATAEESAASSEELSSQATMLKEMIGRFSLRNHSQNHTTSYTSHQSYVPSTDTSAYVSLPGDEETSEQDQVDFIDLDEGFGKYS
jgi:methyl-accepting chemotaxis protein